MNNHEVQRTFVVHHGWFSAASRTSVVIDSFVSFCSNDERLCVLMMTLYDVVVFYYSCFSKFVLFIDKYGKLYNKKILNRILDIVIFYCKIVRMTFVFCRYRISNRNL